MNPSPIPTPRLLTAQTLLEAMQHANMLQGLSAPRDWAIGSYRQGLKLRNFEWCQRIAQSLIPDLNAAMQKAADAGRHGCEFVVGTYGHFGSFDRAGKRSLAKVAGLLRGMLGDDFKVTRQVFGRKRDDHKEYVIHVRWG